jgi:hypothetical protein
MTATTLIAMAVIILLPQEAKAADRGRPITIESFRNREAQTALARLERSTDGFKSTLATALDSSVINGIPLEDLLNEWANQLEDSVDNASREFKQPAENNNQTDIHAAARFADYWGNSMMAATAMNRAMVRRGFAPRAETEWAEIRRNFNRVAQAIGRPALPDMTVIMFRPAPPSVLSQPEVKQVMENLKASVDRFNEKLDDAWFVGMGPPQRHTTRRWAKALKFATDELLDEYRHNDAPEFQFRLEESLMLAAGLNRVLLVTVTSPAPFVEWTELRGRLNILAGRFGYPVVPQRLTA